jgi:hypothetical protein
MLSIRLNITARMLACALALAMLEMAHGQSAPPPVSKIGIKAALLLTPEFCASKTKKGSALSGKETFEIGKAACKELEPALANAFATVTHISDPGQADDAQLVLTPRFVDVDATKTVTAFSNREMIVLLEWTVKDRAGKTVWIETVQGSAKHHAGNLFTYKKNLKLIVEDSVKDVAAESAEKMAAAQELRKVQGPDVSIGVDRRP